MVILPREEGVSIERERSLSPTEVGPEGPVWS